MRSTFIAFCLAVACFAAACGGQKTLAEEAFTSAEASYSAIRADAEALLPEQATMIEEALDAARRDLARGDYREATFKARALPNRITVLADIIAARKAAKPASTAPRP